MNVPKSDLSKLLDLDENQKRIVLDHIKLTGSAVGAEVTLNGIKYLLSDGEVYLDDIYKKIDNLKKKYSE